MLHEPSHPSKIGGPILVFCVDNEEHSTREWGKHLKEHPECGVELVGSACENSEDLPARVEASGAQLVLVDLLLASRVIPPSRGPERLNGLLACQRLKDALPDLIVVAYTQFEEYEKTAQEHGANHYVKKVGNEELVLLIKEMRAGTYKPRRAADKIARLELSKKDLSVSIVRESADRLIGRIGRHGFALLWYLAEEHRQNKKDWMTLELPKRTEAKESMWRMNNRQLWSTASTVCRTGRETQFEFLGTTVDQWRASVHKPFAGRLETNLLLTSRLGPLQVGEHRTTHLRRDIPRAGIIIE